MAEGLVGEDLSGPLAGQVWSKPGSLGAAFGVGILRAPPEDKDGGEHSPPAQFGSESELEEARGDLMWPWALRGCPQLLLCGPESRQGGA